jgi:hypothetical protein
MFEIECKELTLDDQLALAASISEVPAGGAIALVSDTKIRLDALSASGLRPAEIEKLVRAFISKRKDSEHYSIEWKGETLAIHSPDPLARSRGRKVGQLPDNVLACPFCPFVTQYQEAYNVHVRSHGVGV